MTSVLILCGTYLPGFKAGGPVRSVANLVAALRHEFRFGIVSSDRDLGDTQPYPGVRSGAWQDHEGVPVLRVADGRLWPGEFARAVREFSPDIVYVNSYFSPAFSLVPRLSRLSRRTEAWRLVVAPRGEFSPGALAIKSWKKQPFLAIDRAIGLSSRALFHATSDDERGHIARVMGPAARVVVARNISVQPRRDTTDRRERRAPARFLFYSRIVPKKNLDGALGLLAQCREPLSFTIAGPPEDRAYWRTCEALIAELPAGIETTIEGAVTPPQVPDLMARHDFLFLPTRGENFGHVIAEALSAGLPVITSDQAPWPNLESSGAGWSLPLDDEQAWARVLTACATMPPEKYADMSACAVAHAAATLDVDAAIEEHRVLFRAALTQDTT